MTDRKKVLIRAVNLKQYFPVGKGRYCKANDGISIDIIEGETFGLVGESGCGKSTIGRLILGLHQATSGEILFEGRDICKMDKRSLHDLRKDMQIIFQDPYSSLNPRMSISEIISEPLRFIIVCGFIIRHLFPAIISSAIRA